MKNFTIEYDNQPNEVVDKIADVLIQFGLDIIEVKSGDGYCKYKIVEIKERLEN